MTQTSPFSLHDAIEWVDAQARGADTLVRLEAASLLVEELAEVGDAVLGYFVDQARHDGHSWTEIGDALGVSKQAAQQRHTLRASLGPSAATFAHLTPRARNVIEAAKEIARSWGHEDVGTEHLLLALYREPRSIGAQVLVGSGLSEERAESGIAERVARGARPRKGDVTFSSRVNAVFSGALSSAHSMHHNYIGTEHLLLGLADGEGVAGEVLREAGLSRESLSRDIERRLAEYTTPGPKTKPPGKRATTKAPTSKTRAPARRPRPR